MVAYVHNPRHQDREFQANLNYPKTCKRKKKAEEKEDREEDKEEEWGSGDDSEEARTLASRKLS